jgi:hypothetical protein
MAGLLSFKGDPLWKRQDDPGYRVGWRSKAKFEKGHLEGEMTYGEAAQKAAELSTQNPDKTYFPELIITEQAGA